jgi:hypothetical protein
MPGGGPLVFKGRAQAFAGLGAGAFPFEATAPPLCKKNEWRHKRRNVSETEGSEYWQENEISIYKRENATSTWKFFRKFSTAPVQHHGEDNNTISMIIAARELQAMTLSKSAEEILPARRPMHLVLIPTCILRVARETLQSSS